MTHIANLRGPRGLQGLQGVQGIQGEQGIQGNDGLDAYQFWLAAGNTGTENDFLNSLKGEKGDKGDKGNTGAKGDTGEKGDKGDKGDIGVKGDKGDTGEKGDKGDAGEQGEQGISSYEAWLNNGNIGTQQDFLNSLKGEKGDKGDEGLSAFEYWQSFGNGGDHNVFFEFIKGEKGDPGESIFVPANGSGNWEPIEGFGASPAQKANVNVLFEQMLMTEILYAKDLRIGSLYTGGGLNPSLSLAELENWYLSTENFYGVAFADGSSGTARNILFADFFKFVKSKVLPPLAADQVIRGKVTEDPETFEMIQEYEAVNIADLLAENGLIPTRKFHRLHGLEQTTYPETLKFGENAVVESCEDVFVNFTHDGSNVYQNTLYLNSSNTGIRLKFQPGLQLVFIDLSSGSAYNYLPLTSVQVAVASNGTNRKVEIVGGEGHVYIYYR